MAISFAEKGVLALGMGGGQITPVLLEYADISLADAAVKAGTYKAQEAYPLYMRPGIVVPLASGIPTLLLGLFGDKWLSKYPKVQLGLLTYGMTSTTGGVVNLIRAFMSRQAAGIPVIFPKPTDERTAGTALPAACAYLKGPKAGPLANPDPYTTAATSVVVAPSIAPPLEPSGLLPEFDWD